MEVRIKNKELLSTLDGFVSKLRSDSDYNNPKYRFFDPSDAISKGKFYTSDKYLETVMARSDHSGFPTEHYSQPISQMSQKDQKWKDLEYRVKKEFPAEIGAHSSALFNYYPPGGFVGWHTNWNANAYQILFTWSETGDGYFKYWDLEKKEVVTIPDVPGWQCRWYYFGLKNEPEHHCWHAAYTGCDRVTLAYKVFNGFEGKNDSQDILAQNLRDQIIEDIENE